MQPRALSSSAGAPNAATRNPPRLYFGYGSNLWRRQMHLRCPASPHAGLARLDGYRWIINARGYANIVATTMADAPADADAAQAQAHCVWGAVYALTAPDEARLDANEGVPVSYTKEELSVAFWPAAAAAPVDVAARAPERATVLVYIDRELVEEGRARAEYVERMNQGIRDAVEAGVPGEYVERELRRFIPAVGSGAGDGGGGRGGDVSEFALRQAQEFVDEE